MKAEDINSQNDANIFCEGLMNDFEAGILTKSEVMHELGEYTGRLMEMFWGNSKARIIKTLEEYGKEEMNTLTLEEQLAKEIGEMTDYEFEKNCKSFRGGRG